MATITPLGDGGYLETYIAPHPSYSSETLYAQKYTAGGDEVGAEHVVPYITYSDEPQIAALSNGGFVIGSYSNSQLGSHWTFEVFDPASAKTGSVGATGGRLAASPEGGFIITDIGHNNSTHDQDGPEGHVRLFDNTGSVVWQEGPFIGSPRIAVLSNGDYQLTWNDSYNQTVLVIDPAAPPNLEPPVAPMITLIDDAPGSGSDPRVINDSSPVVRVQVSETGQLQYGTTTTGSLSLRPVTAEDVARGYVELSARGAEGENTFRVRAIDEDGLMTEYRGIQYTVDSQAPGAANVLRALDNQGPVQGEIAQGGSTDDSSPALHFAVTGAMAGDQLQVLSGSQPSGQPLTITQGDADRGYLTFTPSLADGAYSFSAQVTDRAGNVGPQGAAFSFTVASSGGPTTLSISGGGSKAEGNSGTTPFDFVVTRSGDTSLSTLVDYFVIGQTNAADFAGPTSGTLTFNPGETSKAVTILVTGDTSVEPDEAFTVGLSNPRGGTIGDGRAEAAILNDDGGTPPPPPPAGTQLAISGGASKAEGNSGTTPFDFTVTRSGDTAGPTLVDYFLIGQTDASDFNGVTTGTISFNPGETSRTITIAVAGDTTVEGNEGFSLGLSNARGGTISQGQSNATILNDDGGTPPPPPAMIGWATPLSGIILSEADAGGFTTYTYEATRSGNTSGTTTVDWRVDLGSTSANDYAGPLSGTITFAPGQTSQTFDVLVAGDGTVESDESFQVQLSNASNASVTLEERNGRIINDDGGRDIATTYSIANAGPADKAEGTGTNTPFEFTVTRNGEASGPGMVDYFTLGQTDAADFSGPTTNTVSFAPGETTKTIRFDVAGDATAEANESFTVGLSNPRGGTIATSQATRTIINDDGGAPPPSGDGQVLTWRQQGDTLTGGAGNDTLNASQGPDQLTGGGGGDHFVYAKPPWNAGVISDFTPGSDKIDVSALLDAYTGSNPMADGWLRLDNAGGSTKVYVDIDGAGGEWPFLITTLQGVAPGSIGLGDFIF